MKPKLMKFDQFARITLQRYERYLPTAFDESLTLLEKMNKLIEYLNEMGLLVNDVVEQWNEVMEWIINDGINDTVLDRLDEMVDDGTLATIINEHIFDELNNKVDGVADRIDDVDGRIDGVDGRIDGVDGRIDGVDDRIDGVDDELSKRATKTTTTITYHVETNGNDNNTGTSTGNAFRTIAKAISMIPDIIADDHEFTISIGNGTWNENVELSNITVNGGLTVEGSTNVREDHKVNRVDCERITGVLRIRNLCSQTQTQVGFHFKQCAPYVFVTNVLAYGDPNSDTERSGYHGLLADYGSNVLVSNSDFSNKLYGIRVNYLSRVLSQNNTGTGNKRGVGARWGGILQTVYEQPSGTTNRTTDSGGVIFGSRGFMFDKERDISDFYLQENIRGVHDGLVSKRLYNIFNINNSNRPIGINQKLVITFSYTSFGPVILDFKYGGAQENDQPQFIHGNWSGNISGIVRAPKLDIISSNQMSDTDVQVRKIPGEQIIELSITPDTAKSGQWGVDLSIQMMRRTSNAPTLLNVQIIDV